ncbi:MAG: hypothetical protein ABSH22_00245 [Tepidisphaeraceae bacterium]
MTKGIVIGAGAVLSLAIGAAIFGVIWYLNSPQTVAIPVASPAPMPPPAPSLAAVAQARADLAVARGPLPPMLEITSPFTDVRWRGNVPEVQVSGVWYELISVNNHPVEEIIAGAHKLSADRWRGAVADSMGEIVQMLGDAPSESVKLGLQTLDTRQAVALDDVAMTSANFQKIRPPPALGAAFSGVRWNGDVTEVEVNGRWYELVAVDDQPVDKIIAYAKETFRERWQKRLAEDLDTVMTGMNHPLGSAVDLQLQNLNTHEAVTMNQVPLTPENRNSILDEHGDFGTAGHP